MLFTGEVERNERTIYGFVPCDYGCNGFADAYIISKSHNKKQKNPFMYRTLHKRRKGKRK
jgi:hypothetical protein